MAESIKQGFPPPFPAEQELGATRFTPFAVTLKNPVGFPPLPPPTPVMKKLPFSAP